MHRFITKADVTASALCITIAGLAGCTKKPDAVNNNAVVGIHRSRASSIRTL